jgi:hypothetical protein
MKSIQEEFKDIHKGKLAFLLGTGVSFADVEVAKIHPYITMAINGVLFKYPNPTYLFSCDGGLFYYGLLNIVSKNTHLILSNEFDFSDEGVEVKMKEYAITNYTNVKRKWGVAKTESVTMRNTDDSLVFGLSSVHCAAHLLYIMGCNPIVLIGCDCRFTRGVYSYWMLPEYKDKILPAYINEEGEADLPHPGKHKEIMKRNLPGHLSEFKQYWETMHRLAPQVPIIDACDSAISCFPKMTLEEVLKNYGDRK